MVHDRITLRGYPLFLLGASEQQKFHHRRPQTAAQIAHEILETSPEHGHGIPDQLEAKMGDKTGDKLGWETSQEGGHRIPDQVGNNMGDKLREKTSPGSRTQHPRPARWKTRPETRERQAQQGGHSIPGKQTY